MSLEQELPNQSPQGPARLGCTQVQWKSVQNQAALYESVCLRKRGQQLLFSVAEDFRCGNTKLLFCLFPLLNSTGSLAAKGDSGWLYSLWNVFSCSTPLLFPLCVSIAFSTSSSFVLTFSFRLSICWIWQAIVQLSKVLKCSCQLAGWLRPAVS